MSRKKQERIISERQEDMGTEQWQEDYTAHKGASEKQRCGIAGLSAACAAIDHAVNTVGLTKQVNIAVDGMCGSGKTTLGEALAREYGCNLFHMDDFFLRPGQRTPQRYALPGGNVDYERFREEVLEHLADREGFTYRRFDCRIMELGTSCMVPYRRLNIIEGAYSCHPYFGDIYQVRLFMEISPEVQRERIIARNGIEMYERFKKEWIPMENKYFEAYRIREQCIVL